MVCRGVADIHLIAPFVFFLHDKHARRHGAIVAAACHPQLAVPVGTQPVQVDAYGNTFHLPHVLPVYNGNGEVVVGYTVAAGIGNINVVADDVQLFRLIAYGALPGYLQSGCVYFIDRTFLCVAVYAHRPYVCRHVCLAIGKLYVTAVGNIYLRDAVKGARIHNLHLV